jgi:Spy/CpxP family protein refolding chaperone
MKRLAGMLLLAALLSPGTARAADLPEGKWWKHPRVAAEINLSSDQVREIDLIFARARPKLVDVKAELEKREGDLQDAIDSNADRREIAARIEATEAARTELQKTRILMVLDMKQVLKPEQWDRLQRLRQEFRRERRERFGRFLERRHGGDRPPVN